MSRILITGGAGVNAAQHLTHLRCLHGIGVSVAQFAEDARSLVGSEAALVEGLQRWYEQARPLLRQEIILDNHRFVGNVAWRQKHQTFDSVSARADLLPHVISVVGAYR